MLPSFDSYTNSIFLNKLKEDEIVNDYLNHPKLPYGKNNKN